MCEAHWSGSAGVASVMEPLLVSLGGSEQAWWTLEGWDGWDGVGASCRESQ